MKDPSKLVSAKAEFWGEVAIVVFAFLVVGGAAFFIGKWAGPWVSTIMQLFGVRL